MAIFKKKYMQAIYTGPGALVATTTTETNLTELTLWV